MFSKVLDYNVFEKKHYDIKVEDARDITVHLCDGEVLKVELLSEELADIDRLFTVNIDDINNRIDIDIKNNVKNSDIDSNQSLSVRFFLPINYIYSLELAGKIHDLRLEDIHQCSVEFGGMVRNVYIDGGYSTMEFDVNYDMNIFIKKFIGKVDINQISANTNVHISPSHKFCLIKKGIKNNIFIDDGLASSKDAELCIEFNGLGSKLSMLKQD